MFRARGNAISTARAVPREANGFAIRPDWNNRYASMLPESVRQRTLLQPSGSHWATASSGIRAAFADSFDVVTARPDGPGSFRTNTHVVRVRDVPTERRPRVCRFS